MLSCLSSRRVHRGTDRLRRPSHSSPPIPTVDYHSDGHSHIDDDFDDVSYTNNRQHNHHHHHNRNQHHPHHHNHNENHLRHDSEKPNDLVTLARQLSRKSSPQVISSCSLPQLLALLPLVMHHIDVMHESQRLSHLVAPLCQRLQKSRRLKLRFLLLRHHASFSALCVRLRYSSQAYSSNFKPVISTACSANHINIWEDPKPRAVIIHVDMVDLQSEDYFRNAVFSQPDENRRIGQQLVSHPFFGEPGQHTPDDMLTPMLHPLIIRVSDDTHEDEEEDDEEEEERKQEAEEEEEDDDIGDDDSEEVGQHVTFGQFGFKYTDQGDEVLELRRLDPDEDEINDNNLIPIPPRLWIRTGEDVLQVQVIQLLFQMMNEIWKRPSSFKDAQSAPFCMTVESMAVSNSQGLVHLVCHERPLSSMDFSTFKTKSGHDAVAVDQLVRSAVGALTAGYALGLQTRSGRELAIKDERTVFWKAFVNPFEVPTSSRTSVPKNLRACLDALKVWDAFKKTSIIAFKALRSSWDEMFAAVAPLFRRCGMDERQAYDFIHSKWSLNLNHKHAHRAEFRFRRWLS